MYYSLDQSFADITDRTIQNERDKTKAEVEAAFLRQVLVQQAQQQLQVMISDQQLTAIAELISANLAKPENMN